MSLLHEFDNQHKLVEFHLHLYLLWLVSNQWLPSNHSTESKIQFPTTGCIDDSVIVIVPQKVLLL